MNPKHMNIKILRLLALLGFSINAASAEAPVVNGNVGAKYSSDYDRRGQVLSAEALQAQVGFNVGFGEVDVFGDFFTNQSTDSTSADTDEAVFGVGTSLFENGFNAYLGVYNTEVGSADNDLEAFASLQANVLLSPTFSFYRDTDEALYTFEGQLSHDLDFELVDLQVAGVLGTTEATASQDRTYYGAKFTAARTFKQSLDVYADVAFSDADDRGYEAIWGLGLRVQF